MALAWSRLVFQEHFEKLKPHVRAMRLLEEALELAQAEDVTSHEAEVILYQVYGKIKGMPHKELGGVLMTVAAYAGSRGYDLEQIFIEEFYRCMDPKVIQRVLERNLSGDKLGLKE